MANGFMGGMGFGQPGVRETKVVSETSEEKIPFRQTVAIFFTALLVFYFSYICLKLLITTRGDWSLLIGIISVPGFPLLCIWIERRIIKRFFPRVYVDFLNVTSMALSDDRIGVIVLTLLILVTIPLIILGFYISVIVPQMTNILANEAQTMFVFCAFGALLVASRPYYIFNTRQLTDSLRDSDSKYATTSLTLENENYWRRKDLEEAIMALPSASPEEVQEPLRPMLVRAPIKSLPEQNDSDKRYKEMVMDFLNGIDSGMWTTADRSWRGKQLNSGHKLTERLGHRIRDELIEAGWAVWNNPDDTGSGWHLNYSVDEIEKGGFNNGSGTIRPSGEGSGESADFNNETDDGE